jgi:hypothetical protein
MRDEGYSGLVSYSDPDLDSIEDDQVTVMTGQTPKPSEVPMGSLKQMIATYQTAEYLEGRGYDTEVLFVNADSFVPGEGGSPEFLQMVEGMEDIAGEVEVLNTSEMDLDIEETRRRVEEQDPVSARYANDYTMEEIATLKSIDRERDGGLVKIGPPSEQPYDSIFSEAFPESGFAGVYMTPTVPLNRGMNQQQIDELEREGGVIPYHDYGARIHLSDSEEDMQEKRRDASGRVEEDLSAVKEFLDESKGEDTLAGHFAEIMQNHEKETASRSLFDHG